eukprot:CAMPEP_0175170800 /NCGR_PEP_ID=MMETSP0087-20121206/30423_1 /TAXON_ID=136419 /ORGANISM="Unknown Unknown, Strain D1" /LENGTH=324 /DNA_ID=CAMNT_0016461489 /DNA_START=11 /DNA_END=983 /DNA_ORIENTATION=+
MERGWRGYDRNTYSSFEMELEGDYSDGEYGYGGYGRGGKGSSKPTRPARRKGFPLPIKIAFVVCCFLVAGFLLWYKKPTGKERKVLGTMINSVPGVSNLIQPISLVRQQQLLEAEQAAAQTPPQTAYRQTEPARGKPSIEQQAKQAQITASVQAAAQAVLSAQTALAAAKQEEAAAIQAKLSAVRRAKGNTEPRSATGKAGEAGRVGKVVAQHKSSADVRVAAAEDEVAALSRIAAKAERTLEQREKLAQVEEEVTQEEHPQGAAETEPQERSRTSGQAELGQRKQEETIQREQATAGEEERDAPVAAAQQDTTTATTTTTTTT